MDTGLHALVAMAGFHQLPAEPDQLAHQFSESGESFSDPQLLQAAKALTLKAKQLTPGIDALSNAMLPAIANARDGSYFIVARLSDNEASSDVQVSATGVGVLIHDLRETAPRSMSLDEFETLWSGELIALTRRQGFGESLQQKFDISWYIPSLAKYRKLFGEVLIASFFLQLFALVMQLFFQVVMDKVLVHRGFTTLDVLAVGFFVVVVFEAFLGGFRNYLFSHTTMCISIPPKYSVSNVVGYLKGKRAITIARRFKGSQQNFSGEHFWARGYFVSTVSLDEEMVREYIRNQEQDDIR